jgi:hypothetical protein
MDAALPSPPRNRLARTKRWVVTLGATLLSTYLLDAVATAAGVALAGSQLLHGLDHWPIVAFLALTYVVWGVGLRVNLEANAALLDQTGTSTSALSKAAHDLAALGRCSPRVRRLASHAGYVATELAKEVPYYAGAFGAAVFTDSVSSNDALVFLAGANLGAAAYEYALGRVTRTFLRLRGRSARAAPEGRPAALRSRSGV